MVEHKYSQLTAYLAEYMSSNYPPDFDPSFLEGDEETKETDNWTDRPEYDEEGEPNE